MSRAYLQIPFDTNLAFCCLCRLLWVDTVEILWVIILSTYGQHQREALVTADGALPLAKPALAEQLVPQELPVAAIPALPAAE